MILIGRPYKKHFRNWQFDASLLESFRKKVYLFHHLFENFSKIHLSSFYPISNAHFNVPFFPPRPVYLDPQTPDVSTQMQINSRGWAHLNAFSGSLKNEMREQMNRVFMVSTMAIEKMAIVSFGAANGPEQSFNFEVYVRST